MTLEILLLLPLEVFALFLSYMGWKHASSDGPGIFMIAGGLLTMLMAAYTLGNAGALTFGGLAEGPPTGDLMTTFLSILAVSQFSMIILAKTGKGRSL